ncbi:MAG: dihydroxyacetone kinase subunit DhaK [Anaerolineae bacterium]|nr:dihydroxyacetone kinase subunit DhaK [Anaerolineae bacterium]
MPRAKKILNDPSRAVPELLEGLVAAYGGSMRLLEPTGALAKAHIPEGKVALLIGGGSGHEPLFPAFIGDNLADGAACGHVFAAPTPDVILAATRAVHRGAGVLYLYGNYAGDNMNFDIAAELAMEEGIRVETVRVWDDVAAAPPERLEDRRGIAGDLFVIKVAGAAAAALGELGEVARVTAKARDHTRSMGVAVAAGSIPETGEPTFELGEDEIEIGMGLHGEPGVARGPMMLADALVDQMLERILADPPAGRLESRLFRPGDEVCLLVNDLGSTTWMELLVACRRAHQVLAREGLQAHDTVVGSFCTCQEMAGFSLTLLRLDEELKAYYDAPCSSLGLSRR